MISIGGRGVDPGAFKGNSLNQQFKEGVFQHSLKIFPPIGTIGGGELWVQEILPGNLNLNLMKYSVGLNIEYHTEGGAGSVCGYVKACLNSNV